MSGNSTYQDLTTWSVDNFRFAEDAPDNVLERRLKGCSEPVSQLVRRCIQTYRGAQPGVNIVITESSL